MTTFELLQKSRAVKLFELSTVLTFGALLTVVTVMTELATVYAGNTGAYALAAISGFADVTRARHLDRRRCECISKPAWDA